jgi:hypothetical protein
VGKNNRTEVPLVTWRATWMRLTSWPRMLAYQKAPTGDPVVRMACGPGMSTLVGCWAGACGLNG